MQEYCAGHRAFVSGLIIALLPKIYSLLFWVLGMRRSQLLATSTSLLIYCTAEFMNLLLFVHGRTHLSITEDEAIT